MLHSVNLFYVDRIFLLLSFHISNGHNHNYLCLTLNYTNILLKKYCDVGLWVIPLYSFKSQLANIAYSITNVSKKYSNNHLHYMAMTNTYFPLEDLMAVFQSTWISTMRIMLYIKTLLNDSGFQIFLSCQVYSQSHRTYMYKRTAKSQRTWDLLSLSPDGSILSHLLVKAFSGSWSNNSQCLEHTIYN